jgi:hypothetical protein
MNNIRRFQLDALEERAVPAQVVAQNADLVVTAKQTTAVVYTTLDVVGSDIRVREEVNGVVTDKLVPAAGLANLVFHGNRSGRDIFVNNTGLDSTVNTYGGADTIVNGTGNMIANGGNGKDLILSVNGACWVSANNDGGAGDVIVDNPEFYNVLGFRADLSLGHGLDANDRVYHYGVDVLAQSYLNAFAADRNFRL